MTKQSYQPPRWAHHIVGWALHEKFREDVLGDLEEGYHQRCAHQGPEYAKRWYWMQVLRSVPAFMRHSIYWSLVMLKNFLKTTVRFLRRQKAYSLINLSGLTIGLACSFLIVLWIQDERSYDQFHEYGESLFHVMTHVAVTDGEIETWDASPKPLAQTLEEHYPEVMHTALMSWERELLFAREDQVFREHGRSADPALFEMFSFPFLQGDPLTALANPRSVVISERLARKYFGAAWQTGEDIVGQSLRIQNDPEGFTVTGVFADIPQNSSLEFDFVLPIEPLYSSNSWLEDWDNSALSLFVQLRDGTDLADFNDKVQHLINDNLDGVDRTPFLQPFGDVYLYSDFEDGQLVGGRIEYVRLFGVIAVFILLIASINFMNLSTARSAQRVREIGVRKAVGASQGSLIGQFLGESLFLTLLAFVLALGLVSLCLPAFNTIIGKSLALDVLDPNMLLGFLGIALVTGLLAGSYPALYLSSFNVMGVLRDMGKHRLGGVTLRKGLVVFQFGLSILLIIGTMTVSQQIDYLLDKDLGLDEENLLYISLDGYQMDQYDAFKQELLMKPGIVGVTASSDSPLSVEITNGDPTWAGKDPENDLQFSIIRAHYDFVETMKMDLVAGRGFSEAFADSVNFLVNEQAAAVMGFEDPVGQPLSFWGRDGEIVGVVKDFHMTSLHAAIRPTIILLAPERTWRLFVRTEAGQTAEAIAGLEAVHKQFNPAFPFIYQFLDEDRAQAYRNEMLVGSLSNYFALLAVFIACLGLFGLASFTAERRAKEISIRRVLGASAPNLVLLLSREFLKLVLIAFLVVIPLAYYVMDEWLSGYAYHTTLGPGTFVLACIAILGIACLTVGYQAFQAALANPVEALRTE